MLTVVWMLAILGMAGLVLDVGSWYRSQRGLQAEADASALAGAQELPDDTATATAQAESYANKNGITIGGGDISFSDDLAPHDSITVNTQKDAPTFFTKLFGLDSVNVHATATARSSVMGAARYAAPITVNINHQLLSGQVGSKQCPCFGVQTTLPLDKRGAPGAFGMLDLNGVSGNGASTLASWIQNGYDDYLYVNKNYSSNTGANFNSSNIQQALSFRKGTVLLFPVYDRLDMQGTIANYHIIAWAAFKLTGTKITGGNSGEINGEFVDITWDGIPAAKNSGEPDLGARTITLTH